MFKTILMFVLAVISMLCVSLSDAGQEDITPILNPGSTYSTYSETITLEPASGDVRLETWNINVDDITAVQTVPDYVANLYCVTDVITHLPTDSTIYLYDVLELLNERGLQYELHINLVGIELELSDFFTVFFYRAGEGIIELEEITRYNGDLIEFSKHMETDKIKLCIKYSCDIYINGVDTALQTSDSVYIQLYPSNDDPEK